MSAATKVWLVLRPSDRNTSRDMGMMRAGDATNHPSLPSHWNSFLFFDRRRYVL